jgi:hypothetical protein
LYFLGKGNPRAKAGRRGIINDDSTYMAAASDEE